MEQNKNSSDSFPLLENIRRSRKQEFLEQEWIIEQGQTRFEIPVGYHDDETLPFHMRVSVKSGKTVNHETPDLTEELPTVDYTEDDLIELCHLFGERTEEETKVDLGLRPVRIKKVK